MSEANDGDRPAPIKAFVSFPSPYTQTLLIQALVATLESIFISLLPPDEQDPPQLQWADYDLMTFDKPHAEPSRYLTSSYVYRKALIRKHQLHLTITEYLAKYRSRAELAQSRSNAAGEAASAGAVLTPTQRRSPLDDGGVPRGWVIELLGVDDLDELLMDELYELGQEMRENEDKLPEDRTWYILKPGFADRAQGIRMFSTEDELVRIFESFESDSEDEDEDEEDIEDSARGPGFPTPSHQDASALSTATSNLRIADDESDEDEDRGTGVMTSQLRFFIIQEYMPRPVLFDSVQLPGEPSGNLTGFKFHLRAYVLVTGSYTVHLSRTMLALFAGSPYTHPGAEATLDGIDLRAHLTNTCLQTDAYGAPTPPEELVKLFWELEGMDALAAESSGSSPSPYTSRGKVTKDWLDRTFARVGEVVAESVKAGAECGSFGLQLVPNAFEIFGVDLLLSFPAESPQSAGSSELPTPLVTLLEYNASPDFHQSGDRLKTHLAEMFRGVVRLSVAPFFGLETLPERRPDSETDNATAVLAATELPTEIGDEQWGWRLVGKGEIRSFGA